MWAGIPTPIGFQPAAVRSHTSIFAVVGPTPTTEITWVALPTEFTNHGVSAAWTAGARCPESQPERAQQQDQSAHPSIVGTRTRPGQVKV